jgi:hypothetical protein
MSDEFDAAAAFLEQFTDDGTQAEHHGVKGQKWGVTRSNTGGGSGSASASLSNPRAEKRAQYKSDLSSARTAAKAGKELTEAQAKALATNGKRQMALALGVYGAAHVALYTGVNLAANGAAKRLMDNSMPNGEKAVNESLKQIGDLSTFVLRKNAGGSWG